MDQHNLPTSAFPDPPKGLPPVTPPSGRFIAQLFLVPGTIVLLAVLLLLAFRYLLGGGYTADGFLRQLDSDNADIRWRGASDLAQVLKRPESVPLKSDARFALALCQRLRTSLDDLVLEENRIQQKTAGKKQAQKDLEWRKLDPLRNQVIYLAAALGDFFLPVGIPLLTEITLRDNSPDVKGNIQRRRQALFALTNLGQNIKAFKELHADQQAAVFDALAQEAGGTDPQRMLWARHALYYLEKTKHPSAGFPDLVEVDKVLAKTADATDRFLRAEVALALYFWDGPLVLPTLRKLVADDGHGTLIRDAEPD